MGQENGCQPLVVAGFVLLQPEYFGRRKARCNGIADRLDYFFFAADALGNLLAFSRCLRIAPELCRPDDLTLGI